MARTVGESNGLGGGVKAVAAAVFVIGMALVVILLVRARPASEPFDPRSGQPDGARGLVLTLRSAGAEVTDSRTVPTPERVGAQRILVLDDRLDDAQRDAVLDFVEAGGVVVVADPASTLHGGSGPDGGAIEVSGEPTSPQRQSVERERNVAPGSCTVGAITELRGVFVPDGVLFPVGPGEPQCFTEPTRGAAATGHSFVIVRRIGDGTIVGLGDNEAFTNRSLRFADNAGLMVSLLVPTRGTDVVVLIGRGANPTVSDVGSGDDTLRDLVPTWAWMALVLGGVAFVVFAVSRSAREGRILTEPIATPIAGSELVSATGNLMQRAGHASHAGWLLLSRLHRDLCRAHGVDIAAPLADLDRAVAERSGVASGETEQLLRRTAHDNASLVELTRTIDRVRRAVLGSSAPAAAIDDESTSDIDATDERVTTP